MGDIVIHLQIIQPATSGNDLLYSGIARTSDMDPSDAEVGWVVQLDPGVLASTVNSSCKTAAINAVETAGYETVGALDKKTIFGGAIGL